MLRRSGGLLSALPDADDRAPVPGLPWFNAEHLARAWVRVIVVTVAILWVLDFAGNLGGLAGAQTFQRFCNLAREDGVGSFVAIAQMVLISAAAWGARAHVRHLGLQRQVVLGWTIVAVFFTFLAVDDGAMIHERVGTAFRESVIDAGGWFAGWPTYAWQIVMVPFLGSAGAVALGFLAWQGNKADRIRVVAAGGLQVFAVALDALEGTDVGPGSTLAALGSLWPVQHLGLWFDQHPVALAVHLLRIVEETGEIACFTLLACVVLRRLPPGPR